MDIINQNIGALMAASIGLAGAVVGGVISQFGTSIQERKREARSSRGLAAALLAEVRATLHVEEALGYRSMYEDTLDSIKQGNAVAMPNISFEMNPARSVYYSNLARIGTLPPPISEKIVRLYYEFETVVADRMCMDRGEWDKQELSQRISMLEYHLKIYDAYVDLAQDVAGHLETASKK